MKYCTNCGNEIEETQGGCSRCGYRMQEAPVTYIDKGGFSWGILGFFIPVVGLTLYLVWRDLKPKNSKAAGIGALVSVVGGVVILALFIIAIFVLIAGITSANPYYYYY